MVDVTGLIIISTLVQTVVITLTLVVFIFQFRSQEKALKESSYQNAMGRYTDYVRMLVENPELTKLLDVLPETTKTADGRSQQKELSPEDKMILAYLMLGYGIVEEIFLLYDKKWIDEETWKGWSAWLEVLWKHPLFRRVHRTSRGMFDKRFEDYVSRLMERDD